MLGLPGIRGCLFDLDGDLTKTPQVHDAAWKEMFDAYLDERTRQMGQPFDPVADYEEYVDGKPRAEGTRSFLMSRGIKLPDGHEDDSPDAQAVPGLRNRKNQIVLQRIRENGVEAYGSVRYVRAPRDAGLARAVVSSSANCRDLLIAAGIDNLFDPPIDDVLAEREQLRGSRPRMPSWQGARALGLPPPAAAVFEDALAGVAAGRAGGFGYAVGVDRTGQAEALREHGADIVVADLAELMDRP